MYEGQQEHSFRSGTIPVALVAGCGKACEIATDEYKNNSIKTKEIKTALLTLFKGIRAFLFIQCGSRTLLRFNG